jgi:septal ring factor EnvC (AmiA/AmiB activator)
MERRRKHIKIFPLTSVFIVLTVFFSPKVLGQQDVSEYEKRLTLISEQIRELRAKIEEGKKKESTILSRLESIGLNKNLIKKELSLYSIQLERANSELASIRKTIPELKARLDREKEGIEKILVTVYKFGKLNSLQFLLQAGEIGTLISESKHLALLAQYQEKNISNYAQDLKAFEAAEREQETKKRDISALIEYSRKKRRELDAEERKNKALVNEIKTSRKMSLQTLEELQERAEELQALIKKLLEEEIPLSIPLAPLYEKKGKLPWPIPGKVTSFFGLQKHPQFLTTTKNNGIEIMPKENYIIVRSIHPGKVIFADFFQGYGNLIIIDHGMTYYSLYGHCSEFLVKKGDLVQAEQPIARVGDIGSMQGISLYFEIRYKTRPLDPLQWLKR